MTQTRGNRPLRLGVWIWPLAAVAGILAWWCTRGRDGRLSESLVGFGVLGLVYAVLMLTARPVRVVTGLLPLAILEGAVGLALLIDSRLDEMGGMLNLLIPAYVAAIAVGAWPLQAMIPRPRRQE